jgi:NAD+ synthase
MKIDAETECRRIGDFIKNKMQQMRLKGVVLGLSGGLDSVVAAFLAARAVGPENILCVFMPEKHTVRDSYTHAEMVAEKLGVQYKIHDITSKLNKFGFYRFVPGKVPLSIIRKVLLSVVGTPDDSGFESGLGESQSKFVSEANALYRIKPRMRMMVLYELAERRSLLVLGPTNKSEYDIGLYVSQGCDDAADVMPLRHLYKTQVRQLAKYLGVPRDIIEKPPSPDFIPGMTDEGVIGLSYKHLDLILLGLEAGHSSERIAQEIGSKISDIDYVIRLKQKSQYRRDIPYVCD